MRRQQVIRYLKTRVSSDDLNHLRSEGRPCLIVRRQGNNRMKITLEPSGLLKITTLNKRGDLAHEYFIEEFELL